VAAVGIVSVTVAAVVVARSGSSHGGRRAASSVSVTTTTEKVPVTGVTVAPGAPVDLVALRAQYRAAAHEEDQAQRAFAKDMVEMDRNPNPVVITADASEFADALNAFETSIAAMAVPPSMAPDRDALVAANAKLESALRRINPDASDDDLQSITTDVAEDLVNLPDTADKFLADLGLSN
jgi:hypothetical protein